MDHSWIAAVPTYSIKRGELSAIVSQQGGHVMSLTSEGKDVLYTGSRISRSGIPILFPFANPLKDDVFDVSKRSMSQHGFARNCMWNLEYAGKETVAMSLNHTMLSPEMQEFYPFEFEVMLSISLVDVVGPALVMQLEVRNLGGAPMPIAPGLHPYFAVDHSSKSDLKLSGVENFDPGKIDWNQPSNGIFYPWLSEGVFAIGDNTVQVNTSKGVFPYCVVWSQNQDEVDHDFVCLEPFTRPTNGLNVDPILVKNQKPWKATYSITIQ